MKKIITSIILLSVLLTGTSFVAVPIEKYTSKQIIKDATGKLSATLTVNVIVNADGTHTVNWDAVYNGEPFVLTIAVFYGKRLKWDSFTGGIVNWYAPANGGSPIPESGSYTWYPFVWDATAQHVTYMGRACTYGLWPNGNPDCYEMEYISIKKTK
jgi:hypothetical protein